MEAPKLYDKHLNISYNLINVPVTVLSNIHYKVNLTKAISHVAPILMITANRETIMIEKIPRTTQLRHLKINYK